MYITAHAGSEGTEPNTLDSLQRMSRLAVQAVEADVRKVNGELVLGHDAGGDVPLAEVFALIQRHPGLMINCDLKEEHLEKETAALAERCGIGSRFLFTGSVELRVLKYMPAYTERIWINAERLVHDGDMVQAVKKCRQYGFRVMNLNYLWVNEDAVSLAAELGIGLSFWTVDEEEAMKKVLACHPANITTRQPKLLKEVMERV